MVRIYLNILRLKNRWVTNGSIIFLTKNGLLIVCIQNLLYKTLCNQVLIFFIKILTEVCLKKRAQAVS